MISLKDREGNVVAQIDERMFPLTMPVTTMFGLREYRINLNYERDSQTKEKTDRIKSVNTSL